MIVPEFSITSGKETFQNQDMEKKMRSFLLSLAGSDPDTTHYVTMHYNPVDAASYHSVGGLIVLGYFQGLRKLENFVL